VAVFVEDLLTLLRQRTRVTPRNAAGREPRECVPAEWTANNAFSGVFETRDMTRLNIQLRASERAGARAAALLERPPLPRWWVAAVVAALLLFAWAALVASRSTAAQLLWWLLPARLQGLLWLARNVLTAALLLVELFAAWRNFPFFSLRDFPEAVCRPFLSHFLRLCPPPVHSVCSLDRAVQAIVTVVERALPEQDLENVADAMPTSQHDLLDWFPGRALPVPTAVLRALASGIGVCGAKGRKVSRLIDKFVNSSIYPKPEWSATLAWPGVTAE
jgi:hypothetical protein